MSMILQWQLEEQKAREKWDFWRMAGYQRKYQEMQEKARAGYLNQMMANFTAQGQSARRQAEIQAEEYEIQARMEEWNAHFQRASAQMSGIIGQINAGQYEREALSIKEQYGIAALHKRREMSSTMGTQVAVYGASGITMEGSPNVVLQQTADRYHEDIAQIIQQGKYEEERALSEAEIQRIQGQVQQAQGMFQAAMHTMQAGSLRTSAQHQLEIGRLAEQEILAQAAAFRARFDAETVANMPEPQGVWNYRGGGFNTGAFQLVGVRNNPMSTQTGKRLLGVG